MTTIDPTLSLARAAALLEAVARDSEQAVDFEVPLSCGLAAGRLHIVLGFIPTPVPLVGDDAEDIRDALREAITLLCALPPAHVTDPVLDALRHAQAAAAAMPDVGAR